MTRRIGANGTTNPNQIGSRPRLDCRCTDHSDLPVGAVMEAVREITEWTGITYQTPNHDYLLDGDKIVAYRPWGTGEIRWSSGKIKIDRRGRKFERLEPNPFKIPENAAENATVEVKGSKGNSYWVNVQDKTCTCPGFTFRGNCKHTKEMV